MASSLSDKIFSLLPPPPARVIDFEPKRQLVSKLCSEEDFKTDWFIDACTKLKEQFKYNRKLWEYCYIYRCLSEHGILKPGSRGLGFGVGKEPLVALFASHGCEITATDQDIARARAAGWVDSNEYSNGLDDLNERGICEQEQFKRLVNFENVDMNNISDKFVNRFDFTWSSCAFEHLGSIEAGKRFIINQMKCLRPGGVAVHTTEYNLSSNDKTIDATLFRKPPYVLFRKRDIEWMVRELRDRSHIIEMDYTVGTGNIESHIDLPPYKNEPHLRLMLKRHVSTSICLNIKKGEKGF